MQRQIRRAAIAAALGTLLALVSPQAQAGCSKRVVLYNASWCPYCRQVRAILARNDIKYSIRDATTAHVQADMIKRFGDTSVPRTLIGNAVVNGVDEARIKKLCR
jgi:glutaredoxin